jgi:hypothetical protein
VTLAARLAALERRCPPTARIVLAMQRGDGPVTYTICGRHAGEQSLTLTEDEYAAYAAQHPVMLTRFYRSELPPPSGDDGDAAGAVGSA